MKKMIKNKKGFTLVELLAVIIILGVLLLIGVPAISKYINNSRKNTYVNQIRTIVNAVSTSVNAMDLPYNVKKGEGIIVPFTAVNLEKNSSKTKSPYSNFVSDKSYILVTYDGNKYVYYVSALDESGYGIPLINEKTLTEDSITTNKEMIDESMVSLSDIQTSRTTVFNTSSFALQYMNHNTDSGITKIKVGYIPYKAGKVIQLMDGSKWVVTLDSTIDDETVNLVSYYNMAITESSYGKQDSSNPTLRFHYRQLVPAVYNSSVDIYPVAEAIIIATSLELENNGINMSGATVKMPEIEDFGCERSNCRPSCFYGSAVSPFWTTQTSLSGDEYIYIVSDSIGNATTESRYGIRMVINNIQKSNIDRN